MKKSEFRNLIREEIKKVLSEATPTKIPVSGKKYTDDALFKGGFIVKKHIEDWLSMFGSDSYSPFGDEFSPNDAVIDANDWLKLNKYPFRMKKAFSDDDGATITWTIK